MKPALEIFPQVSTAGGDLIGIIISVVILIIAYFVWNYLMNKN
jgi:hypothetical protein